MVDVHLDLVFEQRCVAVGHEAGAHLGDLFADQLRELMREEGAVVGGGGKGEVA